MKPVPKIVLIYAAFSALWILVSDEALRFLLHDPGSMALASMAKGWVFIGVTSLLLAGLIARYGADLAGKEAGMARIEHDRLHALQLLGSIAESSHDAIFAKDTAGRYLLFNTGAARLAGRVSAEVLGQDDAAVFPSETAARIMADDRRVMDEGREATYEESVQTDRGECTFLVTKGPLRDGDGKVVGVFGISRDITARKRAEEAVAEAGRQAELASRSKSEFLAMMSHELRTPLNAIIGFSDLMGAEPGGCAPYAADIRAAGQHLLEMVEDLLDVAAIEAGKVHLRPDEVETARLVEAAIRLVRPRAEEKQIDLAVEVASAPSRLVVDERRVKQILVNLLGNAVKFTPPPGAVTLRIIRAADGGVAFTIADTGIGMDEAGMAKAMTFFGQVDGTLARPHGGSGIGLPLSRRLAECHGGHLDLTSRLGQGTVVSVTLPPACVAG